MSTPHKHAEAVKAWADGAKIALDVTYDPDTGKINNIELKDWKQ